jgi:2-dehydro-3-deoxyphosphogluconate aldolase/(4S)-4-hydroxy-2-oxoglutarate aldolase
VTPSEVMTEQLLGDVLHSLLPAEALGGAPVLKAFASPLSDIMFCPTGGIDAVKATTYLALPNVICVGGSWVMPQDAIEAGDWARIEGLAREAAALKRG